MGKHDLALQNANQALIRCESALVDFLSDPNNKLNKEKLTEKVRYVAISYHNVGVEEEHRKNYQQSLEWYEKAYLVFEEYSVLDEPLYIKFKNSY